MWRCPLTLCLSENTWAGSRFWLCQQQSCHRGPRAGFCVNISLSFSGINAEDGDCLFNFLREHRPVFQSGYTILHSHQPRTSDVNLFFIIQLCKIFLSLKVVKILLFPSNLHLVSPGIVVLNWGHPAPRGHWMMSGDICGFQNLGCCSTPPPQPQCPGRPPTEDGPAPNDNAKAEKSSLILAHTGHQDKSPMVSRCKPGWPPASVSHLLSFPLRCGFKCVQRPRTSEVTLSWGGGPWNP